jgi:ribose transport system ATP-binding protein
MVVETKTPILSLSGISKSYGPTEVLSGLDLDIYSGEVVALLGENGAGKSTVSNIVAGAIQPTSGKMSWMGQSYSPMNPREAIQLGLGLIHQELKLLEHLSIAENVFVGRWIKKNGFVDRKSMEEQARAQLERLGLKVSPRRLVRGLSTANQQLVEIAKALTLNVKLLTLDEPTAALGSAETQLLFKQIRKLQSQGVGIIYISHRLEEIQQIANRIIVMRDGSKVREFDSGNVPVRTIVETMVGRSMDRMFPQIPKSKNKVILEIKGLSSRAGTFTDVNFEVKEGEIFGISGLVGAGRTELVRAITGADPIDHGKVYLRGCEITPKSPRDSISKGMVLVPEDRKLQGLVLDHRIDENIAYANQRSVSKKSLVTKAKVKKFTDGAIKRFGVKGIGSQIADEMSGGNQQKVVLAKWLAQDPKVVVLDEPTRGIDVGARSAIYEIIIELAIRGIAVIVVSSDLEEVLGVSNRIMVMAQGKQTGILEQGEANDVSIMELATG